MSDDAARPSLEARLAALRARMEEGLPARAALLRAAIERFAAGEGAARDEIRRIAHKLRGTAGSHGHTALGDAAESVEVLATSGDARSLITGATALISAIRQATQSATSTERRSSPPPAESASIPRSLAGRRVLAIDDDGPTRRLLELTLATMAGADARVIELPEEGIELLERERFDIVIVDAMMPSMTGLAFVEAARGRTHGSDVPLVVLSAASCDELRWELPAGTRWLRKPFRPRELLTSLAEIVGGAPPR